MAINGLARVQSINLADRIPVGSAGLGGDASVSLAALLAFIIENYPSIGVPGLADLPDLETVDLTTENTPLANALSSLATLIAQRQAQLISGTNVKTVAGQSILGAGDIAATATTVIDSTTSTSTTAAASANTARLLATQITSVGTTASGAAAIAAGKLDAAAVGATVAPLINNLVPAGNLPSFVDDVLEFANFAALPNPGETGKIYVTTGAETVSGTAYPANTQRRWSGSAYVVLVASPGTTDNVVEGAGNKYFTDARANTALAPTLAGYAPVRGPVSVAAGTALTKADHANRDLELTGTGAPTVSGTFAKGDGLFPFNATGASITYGFLTAMAGRKTTYAPNETASLRYDGMYWRSDDADVTAAAPVLGTISGTTAADTSSLTYTPPANYVVSAIQWQRDGADISGATSATYAKTGADYGHSLRAKVGPAGLQYLTNVIAIVAAATQPANITDSGTNRTSNTTANPRSDGGTYQASSGSVWGTDSNGIYCVSGGGRQTLRATGNFNTITSLVFEMYAADAPTEYSSGLEILGEDPATPKYPFFVRNYGPGIQFYFGVTGVDWGGDVFAKSSWCKFTLTRNKDTGNASVLIQGTNYNGSPLERTFSNLDLSGTGGIFQFISGGVDGTHFRNIVVQTG